MGNNRPDRLLPISSCACRSDAPAQKRPIHRAISCVPIAT